MEAEVGIEPTNDGFANRCLTTWLLRRDARGAGGFATCWEAGCQSRDLTQLWDLLLTDTASPLGYWIQA